MLRHCLCVASLCVVASASQATTIFSENFNLDSLTLNKTQFLSGWEVTAGAVDLIGVGGSWNLLPGAGRYIDLDGTIHQGGTFTKTFELQGGMLYNARFFLAGNHRHAGNDQVDVTFGDQHLSFTIDADAPFTLSSMMFTPGKDGKYLLSFHNGGSDNMGALLDDVSLDIIFPHQRLIATDVFIDIPEPSTGLIVFAGFGLAGWLGRRQSRAQAGKADRLA